MLIPALAESITTFPLPFKRVTTMPTGPFKTNPVGCKIISVLKN
jgi:hypothetical protein